MTNAETLQLIAAFTFVVAPTAEEARTLERFTWATGAYLIANAAAFDPAVNDSFTRLRELLVFLNNDGPLYPRGVMLIAVNDVFGIHLHKTRNNNELVSRPLTIGAKCNELHALPLIDKQRLRHFYNEARRIHARDEETWVEKIVGYFIDAADAAKVNATADVLPVLDRIAAQLPGAPVGAVDLANAQGRLAVLNYDRIHHLIRVMNKYPAWNFPGFTRWGPGDNGTPALNYRIHFLKHVCNSTRQFLDESVWWWNALEIHLPIAELRAPDPLPDPNEAALFLNGILPKPNIKTFLDLHLVNRPDLMERLLAAFGPHYTDYALRLSREMGSVIVENNKMISGFTGKVIVFGRFDAENLPDVGISSCYFVLPAQRDVKLAENKSIMLITMA